ncbi:MAG: hypothetical protein HN764_13025 [Gammaproteobacteria bacterium]|nr:hypothetical protein [Gammaproteobacteria bacterium]
MLVEQLLYRPLYIAFVVLFAISIVPIAQAEHPDVAFYVAQKFAFHEQDVDGKITTLGYYYNGEVFRKPEGIIHRATMTGPDDNGKQYELKDKAYLLVAEGGPLNSLAELDEAFPNGLYRFDIVTEHGEINNRILKLAGKGGNTDIAPAPKLTLYQNNQIVSPNAVNADLDLLIKWSPFTIGEADANGILDDVITVVTEDCHGKTINRTPLPFYGDKPAFTFRDTQHTVPAGTLKSGRRYRPRVEHINIVYSNDYMDMPELASYGSVTKLYIHTTGENVSDECP